MFKMLEEEDLDVVVKYVWFFLDMDILFVDEVGYVIIVEGCKGCGIENVFFKDC